MILVSAKLLLTLFGNIFPVATRLFRTESARYRKSVITQSLSQHPPLLHLPPVGFLLAPPPVCRILSSTWSFSLRLNQPFLTPFSRAASAREMFLLASLMVMSVLYLHWTASSKASSSPPRLVTSCWNSRNRSSSEKEPYPLVSSFSSILASTPFQ